MRWVLMFVLAAGEDVRLLEAPLLCLGGACSGEKECRGDSQVRSWFPHPADLPGGGAKGMRHFCGEADSGTQCRTGDRVRETTGSAERGGNRLR